MELAILAIVILAYVSIGVFTFAYNTKSWTNRFFLLFSFISAAWATVHYLSLHQPTPDQTLYVIRWEMFFAALHALSLFLTIHTFPSPRVLLKVPSFIFISLITLVTLYLTQTDLIF